MCRSRVEGVAIAATSCPEHLLSGSRQISCRLRRHLHPIHTAAAAAAGGHGISSSSSAALDGDGPLGLGRSILSTFSESGLMTAVAQHTLALMAGANLQDAAYVFRPAGASRVLAAALEGVLDLVRGWGNHRVHCYLSVPAVLTDTHADA